MFFADDAAVVVAVADDAAVVHVAVADDAAVVVANDTKVVVVVVFCNYQPVWQQACASTLQLFCHKLLLMSLSCCLCC